MKKRLLCPYLPTAKNSAQLSEVEAHHAIHVLRLRNGDEVEAIDGKGSKVSAILVKRGDDVFLEWVEDKLNRPESHVSPITLEIAVLKGQAMEWVIEKAVELGVQKLTPILTDHTVVQVKEKSPAHFRERWEKIANQSLKQCGRLHQMTINPPTPLKELLLQDTAKLAFQRLWCDEKGQNSSPYLLNFLQNAYGTPQPSPTPCHILIGPEGGWSDAERKHLASLPSIQSVHLGDVTLRAETAALFTVSLISAFVRKK